VKGFLFHWQIFPSALAPISILQLENIKGNTAAGKHWFLADLSVVDGFRATVAVERSYSHLEIYAWN
jgi:hypothetical protein